MMQGVIEEKDIERNELQRELEGVLSQFEALRDEKEIVEQKYTEAKSTAIARTAQVGALDTHQKMLAVKYEGQAQELERTKQHLKESAAHRRLMT